MTATMALYGGIRSHIKAAAGTSEVFGTGVGVHQGSVLSPIVFIVYYEDKTTREGRKGVQQYSIHKSSTTDGRIRGSTQSI